MRIRFYKLSGERHRLEVVRGGRSESVECETRSYLTHDLLHYAVESQAELLHGFWGTLARGATLEQLNERSGKGLQGMASELAQIEPIVGALHGSAKGVRAAELVAGVARLLAARGQSLPRWLDERFVAAVQERMRQLRGHWKATPYGGVLELEWSLNNPVGGIAP